MGVRYKVIHGPEQLSLRISLMFFLLRSAFCLAIVFSWMTWPQSSGSERQSSAEMLKAVSGKTKDMAAAVANRAAVKLEESCTKKPADCLANVPHVLQIVTAADALGVIPPKRPMRNDKDSPRSGGKPSQK